MRPVRGPARPRAVAELGYNFIGGLKANAKAYIAITAPTVNSYKRLVVGAPTSGATWAPAYVSYGYNNRTQMLRIPAAGRVEDRTVDGSCNPYLAATAMLAAGLDGIERGLDAGEPNSANLYDAVSRGARGRGDRHAARPTCSTPRASSRRTTRCARRSARPAAATTSTTSSSASGARSQAAHEQITQWELDRYLQLY